ncbi:DNA repair protein RadC [archaeon]|nr:DNA repair protein RadC [Nanoarchaeota archaeon]MBU4300236.1 DNA repair protein RadC [Nanoarchaeota archaeon]MBU4451622.1 DNA repair protein RadC [Nanoarchaeota archaeon]MCG2723144.1 DNA repair protein RadC [archaeon]
MRIADITLENRPRERLQKHGVSVLGDAELLAIILKTGTRGENVIDMSNRLISRYGVDKLSELSLPELQEIKGIGPAKAMTIKVLFELNKRHALAKKKLTKITCAKDVYELMKEKLSDLKQEVFVVLYLDAKNHVLKEEIVTKGTLDASLIHPREVFRGAIKESAHAIIVVHNHPSGDPSPSEEDKRITEKLSEAGGLLDIKMLDHVVVGRNGFYSFDLKI